VARSVRFLLIPLGAALLATPFIFDAAAAQTVASIIIGAAVIALCFRRGRVRERYGSWNSVIV
jgi:hypothetical protein